MATEMLPLDRNPAKRVVRRVAVPADREGYDVVTDRRHAIEHGAKQVWLTSDGGPRKCTVPDEGLFQHLPRRVGNRRQFLNTGMPGRTLIHVCFLRSQPSHVISFEPVCRFTASCRAWTRRAR